MFDLGLEIRHGSYRNLMIGSAQLLLPSHKRVDRLRTGDNELTKCLSPGFLLNVLWRALHSLGKEFT